MSAGAGDEVSTGEPLWLAVARDRHDADGVRALRVLLVLGPVAVLLAVALAVSGWQPWQAPSSGPVGVSSSTAAPVVVAAPVGAVCGSDLDCARYSLAHGVDGMPLLDDRGEPVCLPGAVLWDTEVPGWGLDGVVCRPLLVT